MAATTPQAKRSGSGLARLLAPLAIVLAAIALFAVISASMSSDEGGSRNVRQAQGHRGHHPRRPAEDTYVVQPGDTLGGIAAKTGVSVDELQQLNPDIDTQALVPGSTLKLR